MKWNVKDFEAVNELIVAGAINMGGDGEISLGPNAPVHTSKIGRMGLFTTEIMAFLVIEKVVTCERVP